jgi:hypothetical protein
MRLILIWSAIAAALFIGWLFRGRQLTLLLDRVWTVRTASLPTSPITFTTSVFQIGEQTMYTFQPGIEFEAVKVTVRRDSSDRLVLSIGGKDFTLGPGTVRRDITGFPKYEFGCEPGDRLSFTIDRSFLSWPTPFEMNFMTGVTTSWRRNLYYRLVWTKASGARLEMVWRAEDWFYRDTGWRGTAGANTVTTGLILIKINGTAVVP